MLPSTHFIASTILVFLAWPFFGFWALAIYLGGFFVDVDHYLVYLFRKKDFSIPRSVEYFKKDHRKGLYIFHTIETIVPLFILAVYHIFFLATFIGLMTHLIMDWIYEIKKEKRVKPLSIIYYILKNKL